MRGAHVRITRLLTVLALAGSAACTPTVTLSDRSLLSRENDCGGDGHFVAAALLVVTKSKFVQPSPRAKGGADRSVFQ